VLATLRYNTQFLVQLQYMLGFLFYPVSWLMGVQWSEVPVVSQLLALKIIANEFVAYEQLAEIQVSEVEEQ
jgi:concentrative nucleoside transporter, CNT family